VVADNRPDGRSSAAEALAASLPTKLAGHGLVLRRVTESDVDANVSLARDEDVRETRWLPVAYRCSRQQAEQFVRSWRTTQSQEIEAYATLSGQSVEAGARRTDVLARAEAGIWK
jgi:hypothetical protein